MLRGIKKKIIKKFTERKDRALRSLGMLLNLRVSLKIDIRSFEIFCGAIETEHNLHREKEANRRDR
jgi:hypothetical protein